jgi:general secretion pathway protein K
MLIVALAAVLATQMTARLQLQMQRTSNISFNQQAYWYAMGAEAFAKRILMSSFDDEEDVTHLEQMWAQGETSFPVDFGQITGEVTDLQACFNLNALKKDNSAAGSGNSSANGSVNKTAEQKAFEELIIQLNIEGVGQFEAEYMADALVDWLDSDSAISSAGGAEDNDYSAKEFPYLAANNYLASVNELRIIEHFTVPVINKLKETVCIIPNENTLKINLNTIKVEHAVLLQSLLDIPLADAQQALSAREGKGYSDSADFFGLAEISKHKNITDDQKKLFVVDSEYFKLQSSASFNNSFFSLTSILQVNENNRMAVISRAIGQK